MPERMSIEGKRSPYRKTTLEKLAPEKNPLEDGGQKKPEPKQFLLYATPNGVVREPLGRPEEAKLVSRTQPTIMLDKNTILYPRNEKQLVLENVETGTANVLIRLETHVFQSANIFLKWHTFTTSNSSEFRRTRTVINHHSTL